MLLLPPAKYWTKYWVDILRMVIEAHGSFETIQAQAAYHNQARVMEKEFWNTVWHCYNHDHNQEATS